MINRYTRPEMGHVWSDQNRFQKWLDVEIAVCEAQSRIGAIPETAVNVIKEKAAFDVGRVHEIEAEVKHDVIAFLTNVAEHVGENSRFIHLGMTSNDVLDTSLSLQLKEAGSLLLEGLKRLQLVVKKRANEFKLTPCMGRTHGVHAEPVTFGLKLALWYEEIARNIERLDRVVQQISVVKISGAVGTFEHLDPRVEEITGDILGLRPVNSTQVVPRDLHADYVSTIAIIGTSLERFSTEIRNLQRTEILEAEEYFSEGQKGSSAMPHKRNPITCERVAGLARILRGHVIAALENLPLWHERDITHSSVERVILPDCTITLDYMITIFTGVVERLLVYPERMMQNIHHTRGLIFSQPVLLALARKGLSREKAYKLVQESAMKVWKSDHLQFKDIISSHEEIKRTLTQEELDACFDLKQSTRQIDYLFKRAGI